MPDQPEQVPAAPRGDDIPTPDQESLLGAMANATERPVTPVEVYYLLERFGTLTIWDVYNLEPPGALKPLELTHPHYHLYDRGSCLIAAPKDLFSHERTLEDALQAARLLAQDAHKRGWTVEFAGFEKMILAAWVELQLLADQTGKEVDVLHFSASPQGLKIYTSASEARKMTPGRG